MSVASSCHYIGNSKNGKNLLRQMPRPSGVIATNPRPWQKLGFKSPRVGANFWCKSPGVREGIVMDEIDTCVRNRRWSITAFPGIRCSKFQSNFTGKTTVQKKRSYIPPRWRSGWCNERIFHVDQRCKAERVIVTQVIECYVYR